ncbi:MAG: PAS domain S-box protein [Ignavibacteria bacterium]|nr:PAS domain S-box protein [Ignavibacteria bacterium]
MSERIKILVAEDNKNDLKLLEKQLKKEYPNYEIVNVETEHDYRNAITDFKPDIIISDYSMPTFDGMSALKIKLEMLPLVPFIIVTGSINEETAVRCLKAGADDYVIKEQIPQINKSIKAAFKTYELNAERRKAEAALIENEEKYRTLVENLAVGVYQIAQGGEILEANPAFRKIIGFKESGAGSEYQKEVLSKYSVLDFYPDNDVRNDFLIRITEKGEVKNEEMQIYDLNKNLIWVSINAKARFDEAGKLMWIDGVMENITKRKESEEEIKKLSRAMEQSPALIIITDIKGNIEFVNPKFVEVTGYKPDEVIGKNPRLLKSGITSPDDYSRLWKTISSGKEWRGEIHNRKKNGELYWESASISPIRDSKGNITHYLAVKEDITEKKKKEIELLEAKEKAEEMSRLKSFFLANMSHELRTPMVAILGFSEILSDIVTEGEAKEYVDMINKGGTRLMETLNLILNLSLIEAEKLTIVKSKTDIAKEINEMVAFYKNTATKKNLYINTELEFETLCINLDGRILREVISNLLNNAIKYTANGGITINANKEKRGGKICAVIRVKDTGIGIPADKQDLIWEEYRQVSEGYNRSFEGTGLGLTITKNFVEKLGGDIFVEKSEVGKGSVFLVSFPLYDDSENNEQNGSSQNSGRNLPLQENKLKNVLYVEDDEDTVSLVKLYLEDICCLDEAGSSIDSIKKLKKKKYDAILMDINLGSGANGLETVEMIRMMPDYENTPIIAVTAFAMVGDKEEFLQKGCSDYLSKPFRKDEIQSLVKRVLKET